MSERKETTLSEIVQIIPGYAFKGKHFGDNGTLIVKIKDINPPYVVLRSAQKVDLTNYSTKNLDKYKLDKGQAVLAMTGATIGKIGILRETEEVYVNQRVAKIAEKDGFNYKFAIYSISGTDFQTFIQNNIDSNSAQENISATSIGRYPVLLPPPEEQRAIASVLSSLDEKIDLLYSQNQTLEQMAETLFRQWFVEEADDDWEEGVLEDVIEIFDNKRVPLSKMQRNKMKDGELYPYYGAASVMDYVNDYLFDGEYILLGEDGTVRTDEGYPVLQYATGKFWVNNHAHILRAKEPYNNFFIWNYLSKKNIDRIVTGAVQLKINQGNLKALDFPKFPTELVKEFNKQVEPLFQKINQNKTQIRTLTALRDTLLPKLMSGEVRIEMDESVKMEEA